MDTCTLPPHPDLAGDFAVAGAFLDTFTQGRFADLTAYLTPGTRFRALLPPRVLEGGTDLMEERFTDWFGGPGRFVVDDAGIGSVGRRIYLRWRVRAARGGVSCQLEQHVYLSMTGDKIGQVDLICSGFQPIDGSGS
jgi:hypothetical protein